MATPRDPDALAATLAELLGAIRLRFYLHRPADYQRDRRRLLHAVTWPATCLDERGLTCAPPRYHTLIEERLQAIAAHGNPTAYGAYFPAYLLKCLQDWFDRYGDELYSELKHTLQELCGTRRRRSWALCHEILVSALRVNTRATANGRVKRPVSAAAEGQSASAKRRVRPCRGFPARCRRH